MTLDQRLHTFGSVFQWETICRAEWKVGVYAYYLLSWLRAKEKSAEADNKKSAHTCGTTMSGNSVANKKTEWKWEERERGVKCVWMCMYRRRKGR